MNLAGICALLSSILAGYAALDLLPETAGGRIAAFAVWLVAVYPADRLMASTRDRPWWHHWAGSAPGVLVFGAGYVLTDRGVISEPMSMTLSVLLGIFVVGSVLAYSVRKHRADRARHTG